LVLARNATKFAARYPELVAANPEVLVNASFGFNLSPKGELLTLRDAEGALVEAVEYDDGSAWPREPDGGMAVSLAYNCPLTLQVLNSAVLSLTLL
jgi:hypothetical protein